MALQGGTSTQLINILEVLIDGQATTSAPTMLQLARDSTVAATPTALAAPNGDGPMHPSTAALWLRPVSVVAAGTSSAAIDCYCAGPLELGLNAFGGIMKWNPYTPIWRSRSWAIPLRSVSFHFPHLLVALSVTSPPI